MSANESPENPPPEIPEAEQIRYHVSWMAEPFIKLPGPYRRPQVGGPNIALAGMLMRLWAGPNSELTQTLQLHNHHMHHMVQPPAVAGIVFDAIGNADLQHLHILGQAIIKLGEQLEYCAPAGPVCVPWNGTQVNPGISLQDRIALDIALKERYIQELQEAIRVNPDPLLELSLRRILEEEELHIRVLQRLAEDFAT